MFTWNNFELLVLGNKILKKTYLKKLNSYLTLLTCGIFNKGQMIFCNKKLLQRLTNDSLQRATSVTSNERVLQRAKSNFLQRETSATSNG